MASTTMPTAALETNNSQIRYGQETTWGTAAGQFQAIRYNSSTLAPARTTQRPSEISGTREAAQSVTTQVTAGGTINFNMSATTFDELVFANVMQADWGSTLAINSTGGDMTVTASSGMVTLSSSTPNKYASVATGSWIRLLGFPSAANNTYWYVTAGGGNSPDSISLIGPNSGTAVSESASGSNGKLRGANLRNGKTFKSYFVEQALASNLLMQYPGSYASRVTLTGGLGAFMTGTVDLVSKSGTSNTVTSSSPATILAAPTGRVVDPIGGFVGAYWGGATLGTGVQSFGITLENTGAASEFQMGSTSAQGVLGGTFTASGTMRVYFTDMTLYNNVLNETTDELAFIVKDSDGITYAFTFLDAKLNGTIAIGGPGQPVSVDYTIEAGPTANGTFVIDKMAAS